MIANFKQASSTLLSNLNPSTFREDFNKRPFLIGHELENHPLFEVQNILDLSQRLPEASVEYNAGDLPVSQDPGKTPRNGLSVRETIERIEHNKSWLVIKNVEQDGEYGRLLDDCLNEVAYYSDPVAPGMTKHEGFIFISSPGSVTPYHIDPENNFLLQVRGSKNVRMFDPTDREILSEAAIEEFFAGAHRNLEFDQQYDDRGWKFELNPGDGLHFPVVAPHWVENGPEVSISFSITFQTDDSMRRQSLHRLNRTLRRLGLKPTPVGTREFSDTAKFQVVRSIRTLKGLVGQGR